MGSLFPVLFFKLCSYILLGVLHSRKKKLCWIYLNYIKTWVCHFLFQILSWRILQIHHLNCYCENQYCYNTFEIRKENQWSEEFSVILTEKHLLGWSLGWLQNSLQLSVPTTAFFYTREVASQTDITWRPEVSTSTLSLWLCHGMHKLLGKLLKIELTK